MLTTILFILISILTYILGTALYSYFDTQKFIKMLRGDMDIKYKDKVIRNFENKLNQSYEDEDEVEDEEIDPEEFLKNYKKLQEKYIGYNLSRQYILKKYIKEEYEKII